jgi:hypothetical protein
MNRSLNYFFIIWIINFLLFFILAVYLGGDALGGGVINGHYFLSNHGRLTEVSHRVFVYSTEVSHRVFVYSEVHSAITIVLGFLGVPLLIIANRQNRQNKKGSQSGQLPSTQL